MTRPILRVPIGFTPTVVDKVERLLELLAALHEDPILGDVFVLHGGTALNLFYDDAPRLSVDIDLMFVGAVGVEEMRRKRPEVDERFRVVVSALGYAVQGTNSEHSGQTYRVKYPGDYVKVDVSYLARVPLLEPEVRTCLLAEPDVRFNVLELPEIAAGKVKAMTERLAARDLFDLYRLATRHPDLLAAPLSRALVVYAFCAVRPVPARSRPLERARPVPRPAGQFTEPLYAMLRADEVPDYQEMLSAVGDWLRPMATPTRDEREYMVLLDTQAVFKPELLLSAWPDVLMRARQDPVMAWKAQNLRRRIEG